MSFRFLSFCFANRTMTRTVSLCTISTSTGRNAWPDTCGKPCLLYSPASKSSCSRILTFQLNICICLLLTVCRERDFCFCHLNFLLSCFDRIVLFLCERKRVQDCCTVPHLNHTHMCVCKRTLASRASEPVPAKVSVSFRIYSQLDVFCFFFCSPVFGWFYLMFL